MKRAIALGLLLACGGRERPAAPIEQPAPPASSSTPEPRPQAIDPPPAETETTNFARYGSPPTTLVHLGALRVNGGLAREEVQHVIRASLDPFYACVRARTITARVVVKLVIDRKGAVSTAQADTVDPPDDDLGACVVRAFSTLKFPEPRDGIVTVVAPILFGPAHAASGSNPLP